MPRSAVLEAGRYRLSGEGSRRAMFWSAPAQCYRAGGHRARAAASSASPRTSMRCAIAASEGIGDFETLRHFAQLTARDRRALCRAQSAASPVSVGPQPGQPLPAIGPALHRSASTSTSRQLLREFPLSRSGAPRGGAAAPPSPASSGCRSSTITAVWTAKAPRARGGLRRISRQPGLRGISCAQGGDGPRCAWPLRGAAHGRDAQRRTASPIAPSCNGWPTCSSTTPRSHRNLYHDLALGCAFDGGEIEGNPSAFATRRLDRRTARSLLGGGPGVEPAALLAPLRWRPGEWSRCAASSPPTCAMPRHCASTMCWASRASSGCRAVPRAATAPM